MSEISVMPAPARRQRYSLELKLRIVAASFAPGASIARVAREHGLNANQLFNWRYQYRRALLGSSPGVPTLLPVELRDEQPSTSSPVNSGPDRIELFLPKARLIISGRPHPETLRLLIQALGA